MKRTLSFSRPRGRVHCRLEDGRVLDLPVFRGILKHLADDQIPTLLQKPDVARKYTREAMRKAAWPLLREFPRDWLLECLPDVAAPPGRLDALRFLLRAEEDGCAVSPPRQTSVEPDPPRTGL